MVKTNVFGYERLLNLYHGGRQYLRVMQDIFLHSLLHENCEIVN